MNQQVGVQGGILACPGGASISYNIFRGKNPGVIFLHGFRSDKSGSKVTDLQEFCIQNDRSFLAYDAFGHGQSSGDYADGTIGSWADDAVYVLDQLTSGPQILVGSSFGGWIATLLAQRRPDRIKALIGIAAAPDFTEDLLLNTFTPDQCRQLEQNGDIVLADQGDWRIRKHFIDEARNHLVLRGPIAISCPVRLIHGQQDADVPWDCALQLADKIVGQDVLVTLIKDGEHRLSRPQDLARIRAVVGECWGD